MKKILMLLSILIVGLSSAFAVGLHFSNPYRFIGNELTDGVELSRVESIGFGIHCQSSYEYMDFDLVFPHTVKCKVDYDGITESVSVDAKDTDLNWGMEAMSCWSFPIIDTDNVLFTISPGFHHTMLFFDSGLIYSLGLGGNIQSSFNLGICYLMVGVNIAYDIAGLRVSNWDPDIGWTEHWVVSPRIGIGLEF